jgi:4'-phosphopantetheinyl transferase
VSAPLVFVAAACDAPPGDGWLHPAERADLARLRAPRRRRDFRLGRFAARRALARLEECDADTGAWRYEVRRAAGGVPLPFRDGAPLGVTLSITHSDGWAAAGVLAGGGRLGCDLERIEPRSAAFVADYFTAGERELLAAAHDAPDRDLRATLVWSAKEAVMKALGEGLRLPPVAVSVSPSLDTASAAGWRRFSVRLPQAATELAGSWRDLGGLLLTVAGGAEEPMLVHSGALPGPADPRRAA